MVTCWSFTALKLDEKQTPRQPNPERPTGCRLSLSRLVHNRQTLQPVSLEQAPRHRRGSVERCFPKCPSQEGVRLSHTGNNKLGMKSAKNEIKVFTTFLTILRTVSVTVWKNIAKMQKTRQPSCRLTGFIFYQFLNLILLFLKDPVRRVSSQPNGVVRYVPFF